MVLGFKKQFKEPILAGTKLHSIREDQNDRWKAGRMIQMATGTRSKYYDCFNETRCLSTQRISMHLDFVHGETTIVITIGGRLLEDEECQKLAINDGFKDLCEFIGWWLPALAKRVNYQFSGKVIHWSDLRY